jgi:outer-membrane receptor for ferric coprogen and ferric-rhodotorulic acid
MTSCFTNPSLPLRSCILRSALLALLLLAVLSYLPTQCYAQSVEATVRNYDIPGGPLTAALARFAAESGVRIQADDSLTGDQLSAGLQGSYTSQQGLSKLLAGSGIQPVPAGGGFQLRRAQATGKGEVTLGAVAVSASAYFEPPSEQTGFYTVKKSGAATKLDLSLRETPQSVSVTTRAKIDDFQLDNVNKVLESVTGVTVERVETDRTYYTARGFDITNFQMDGIGIPFTFGNVNGDIDTAVFDRVEVLKGANGLMSSSGNPSATVNFVRKRPTDNFQAKVGVSGGSWGTYRLDGDVSGPLTPSGNVRGRLVLARQDGDSYLDRYSHEKNIYHGVLEADLGDATLLTLGYTRQDSKAKSPLWGALPLNYTDGTPTNYDRSTSTATDWSRWDQTNQSAFLELAHSFGSDWQAKATYTYNKMDEDTKLFYVYGTPDRATGSGLFSYPSLYNGHNDQHIADVHVSGPFQLAGRTHQVVVGGNWSRSKLNDESNYGQGIGTPIPELSTWNGNYPEPAFDARRDGSSFKDQRGSVYTALRLSITDRLKLILGGNLTVVDSSGAAYGVSRKKSDTAFLPYAGAVYDLNDNLSAYANYSEIFSPQSDIGADGQRLKPIEGKSYEVGVKSELFDKRLNASFALFKTVQDNTAEYAGFNTTVGSFYKGVDATSQGLELDATGSLTPHWQASLGYTLLSIEDDAGKSARTFVPRQVLRMSTTYRVPMLTKLKVGANVSWQDKIARDQGDGITVTQSAYLLLNLMARYDITDHLTATVNLNNVTDTKYLTSLYWSQGYYGEPINGSVALNYKF